MIRNILLVIFLSLSALALPEEMLTPCRSAVALDSMDDIVIARIVENLKLDLPPIELGGETVARVVVQPGWEQDGESAVSVYLPQEGDAIIEAAIATTGIAGANVDHVPVPNQEKPTFRFAPTVEKNLVKVNHFRKPIDRDLAAQTGTIFTQQVRAAKFPADKDITIVLHGTTYSFVTWVFGLGLICGETSSPDEATIPGQMVLLAQKLFGYAQASRSESSKAQQELRNQVNKLKGKSAR